MKDAAPWIALYAAAVATGGAVWAVFSYVLAGGRVRVQLRAGAMSRDGKILTAPEIVAPRWVDQMVRLGFDRPVIAVHVTNCGRQPVTIKQLNLECRPPVAELHFGSDSTGERVPRRLEVGQSVEWIFRLDRMMVSSDAWVGEVVQEDPEVIAYTPHDPESVIASVTLHNGRKQESHEFLSASMIDELQRISIQRDQAGVARRCAMRLGQFLESWVYLQQMESASAGRLASVGRLASAGWRAYRHAVTSSVRRHDGSQF
ncbi:hypothetical protein ACGFIR_24815 [Micromonospora sp. NPDC049051]|uniref:hypothetical protein n=1 Tax=Micromonospora sp. NPDC049051 TaxID=3364264 RepID=UPI00371235B2